MRYYNNRDAARHVATNAPAPTVDGQRTGKGGDGDARGGIGGATGGGIFAKTAKTPPLQSGVARMPLRSKCRPIAAFTMPRPSTPYTSSHEPRGFYHDAAWEGRALAVLGTSPTKKAIANLAN